MDGLYFQQSAFSMIDVFIKERYMNKLMLLPLVAALTACGPSHPSETVDFLVAHPERLKEIQRLCKEDRAKIGEELCRRAAAELPGSA